MNVFDVKFKIFKNKKFVIDFESFSNLITFIETYVKARVFTIVIFRIYQYHNGKFFLVMASAVEY